MTCRQFADFIMDYLAGELPDDAREPFEWHLSRCPNCREYLLQYEMAVAAGRRAFPSPDAAVPEDVPEDLVRAVLESTRGLRERH